MPSESGDLAGNDVGLAEQVAPVGEARHQPQGAPLAGTADHDRHVLLQRSRVAQRLLDRQRRALEPRRTLAPQQRQCLQRVFEVGVAPVERREVDPGGGVLLGEPAHPQPAHRPAADSTSSVATCLASVTG